jgi:hypothetical protein
MLLQRLHNYVTEPLYNTGCYVNDEYTILKFALTESQKRILDVLSLGNSYRVHVHMENFPWREFEELLGEHLVYALRMSKKRVSHANLRNELYPTCIFDLYIQKYNSFSFA